MKVPNSIVARFRGRKDSPTQNILAACSFDLKFTYVLAGWEGSASDSRVLASALSRSHCIQCPPGIISIQRGENDNIFISYDIILL